MSQVTDNFTPEQIIRRKRYAGHRARALAALGGVCAHCGADDPRVLVIDHINGGGAKHRRLSYAAGPSLLVQVNRDPRPYQLLCHNCNWIKRLEVDDSLSGIPPERATPSPRSCDSCGRTFTPKARFDARLCGGTCRKRASRRQRGLA